MCEITYIYLYKFNNSAEKAAEANVNFSMMDYFIIRNLYSAYRSNDQQYIFVLLLTDIVKFDFSLSRNNV